MKKTFVKMFGCVALAVASIVALNACSGENGVDGKDGADGKDGVSVTDTLYIFQKDTVFFAGDTIYISKKDTVVVNNRDTVYIENGGSGSGNGGAETGGNTSFGTLIDERDGQTYRTTKIRDQVWMAENLNYAYLQPTAGEDSSSFCYDNNPANCQKYGRLYLWSAVMDSAGILDNDGKGKDCGDNVKCNVTDVVQGVCPKGWHLPSEAEFKSLLKVIEDDIDSIVMYKDQHFEAVVDDLTKKRIWKFLADHSWNNSFDFYGFSALPAGEHYYDYGAFHNLGLHTGFWSSTEYGSGYAYNLNDDDYYALVHYDNKCDGHSVRCLQD